MNNERYDIYLSGEKIKIKDSLGKGELAIIFKPAKKKEGSDLIYGTFNDIQLALAKGKLELTLQGYSTITVKHDVDLGGYIHLKSSHLSDCVVRDSTLKLVCIKPYSTIKNCQLERYGRTEFGRIDLINCNNLG